MLTQMYPVLLYLINFCATSNLCNVFFLHDHVLCSLVVTLETVIDMMIDCPVTTCIIIFLKPIQSHPPDYTSFILSNDAKLFLVLLYGHSHVLSQVLFALLNNTTSYIFKSI